MKRKDALHWKLFATELYVPHSKALPFSLCEILSVVWYVFHSTVCFGEQGPNEARHFWCTQYCIAREKKDMPRGDGAYAGTLQNIYGRCRTFRKFCDKSVTVTPLWLSRCKKRRPNTSGFVFSGPSRTSRVAIHSPWSKSKRNESNAMWFMRHWTTSSRSTVHS